MADKKEEKKGGKGGREGENGEEKGGMIEMTVFLGVSLFLFLISSYFLKSVQCHLTVVKVSTAVYGQLT